MHWHQYCKITVEGEPKAQGRPRDRMMGKHISIYNPTIAKPWRERVYYATCPHKPIKPFECPVRVDVKWMMPRPKRLMRKKDPEGELPCTSKPDLDNLYKIVLDPMKDAGWFRDDSYVCMGLLEKFYHSKDGIPGAEIVVWSYH